MNCKRSENILWEELDGDMLLVDARTGARWHLNAAASAAWKLLDGRHSLQQLAKLLKQSSGNVAALNTQLATAGLLTSTGPDTFALHRTNSANPFQIQPLEFGAAPRRRPSPRGNSGPG